MSEKQPQLNNEILARLGDEHAQAQLDVAQFIDARPETADDILHVPTPAEMVAEASEDFTDEYAEKSLETLIEDLNTSRTKHKEKVQVVDKNGKVVHRYKMINPDPTKTDDLFDALATKLAHKNLSDDGILTVLNQLNKKLSLSDEEVSTVIDKIHFAKEDIKNQADVKYEKIKEDELSNPFNAAPNPKDVMVRSYLDAEGKPVADFDELVKIINQRVSDGDDSDWDQLVSTFADVTEFRAAGEGKDVNKVMERFAKYIASKKKELDESHDRKLPVLYEESVSEPIPVTVVGKQEKKRRWKKLAAVGLGALALVGIGYGGKQAYDKFTEKDQVPVEQPANGSEGDDVTRDLTPEELRLSLLEGSTTVGAATNEIDIKDSAEKEVETAEVKNVEEVMGVENFEVESGNGFVAEILDFAKENNVEISPEQAFAIYSAGLEEFGPKGLITGDTYEISSGNYGISKPGTSSFTPEFARFMMDRLPSKS